MREIAPKLIDCYRSALKTTPKLTGKGLVRITTTAEGKALDARLTGDDAELNPLYAQCIASAALTAKFGPYEGDERRQFTWGLSIVPDGAVGYRLGELDDEKFQAQAKAKQPAIDGSPSLGSADAKVTMVVFTNAECKFCQKHHPTLLRLRRAYGDKVRFVFKGLKAGARKTRAFLAPKPTGPS
jgi:thiol-disulfide isomerase/thioredoxin